MVDRGLLQPHEWVQRRFANLLPDHAGFTLRIISVGGLPAPPGWGPIWTSLPATPGNASFGSVWSQNIPSVEAVVILLHPFKRDEAVRACHLSQALHNTYANTMPPLLWLCHSVAPEIRPPKYSNQVHIRNLVKASTQWGIDGVSTAESEGFRLALDIRMMVTKTRHMTDTFSLLLARRLKMRQQKTMLERRILWTKWEYLASKLSDGMIPRIDHTIPAGIPQQLSGWIVGEQIRHGCGEVYLLTIPPTPYRPHGEQRALRAVPKSQVATVADMKSLKRSIELMHELSSSQWQHPGIAKLFHVFHSKSHILMSIEFGGDMTLFNRLYIRENSLGEHPDLSLQKVCDIITQSVAAVVHMHTGPQICHRDLKPETFLVEEADDAPGLRLKLTDFDLAAWMKHSCRTCCGSLPFVAPEVILQEEYEGGPADIWSLSVLMLEVLCRTHVLESALCLAVSKHGDGDKEAFAKDIRRHFEAEGRAAELLEEHCRPEAAPLLQKVSPVLRETMRISVTRRWHASQVRDALGQLSVSDLGLEPGS